MKNPARLLTAALAALAALLLASCGTNTTPTALDMDRYYRKAEEMAQDRIAILETRRQRGEITQEEFDMQSGAIRAKIANHASELAWARHENIEAQKRALGIPTGDHPVQVQVPGASGESFYRRAGQSGGENFYSNTPHGGSVLGGPNRGERPVIPPPPEPEPAPPPPIDPGT
jgi:hypothetical protein